MSLLRKERIQKRWILLLLASVVLSGCSSLREAEQTEQKTPDSSEQEELAETTPFGKYPDEVVYTLGKMTGTNNSNLPDGDTYEDNAYTRYLKEMLNVQNEDAFEETGVTYDDIVDMVISEDSLPDVMLIEGLDTLNYLVENDMIEDLTDAFSNCASDRIREMYDSYNESVLGNVTYDGKLMALPGVNISDGPQLLWLRKDWLDELGLEEPETLEDAEYIIEQFVEQDPGGNGSGNTVGLVCVSDLCGETGYNYEYQLDIVFAAYDSYPQQWMMDEEGNYYYGGVQPQTRDALAKLREWYEEGILDNQFLIRTENNIADLIIDGKCGSFFAPWWAPNNPLMEAVEEDPQADWQPYLLTNTENGTTRYAQQNASTQFIVVRKGYEHPEVVVKIISVLFDYARYSDADNEDFISYYQQNVDPTARPLSINVDYSDALNRCFQNLTAAINGETETDRLDLLERAYYQHCVTYLSDPEHAEAEEWAAYTSRITACEILAEAAAEDKVEEIQTYHFAQTETMTSVWWKLQEMQKQAYLQIITGEKPLSYFDTFVEEWYEEGGAQILSISG